MRSSNVFMLASLASYALALPTDLNSRTLGSAATGLVSDVVNDLTGILSLLLGDNGQSPATLLDGLSAPAAAALEGGALGCKASAVHSSARKELANWLNAHGDAFHAPVTKSLLGWCNGGDAVLPLDVTSILSMLIPTCADKAAQGNLIVTLDGIFDAVEYVSDVVLNASAQSSLTSFLSGTIASLLDTKIKAGLGLCASGGVAADLSVEIKTPLLEWLTGPDCTLGVSLKASVLSWLHGKVEGDCMALDSLPTGGLSVLSVGAAVESLVTEAGILVETVQATLAAFLKSDLVAELDQEIISALHSCSKGGAASVLSIEVRTVLAKWLASSDCQLGAELKSVLVFWLSFAVVDLDVSISLPGGLISEITSLVTGTVDSLIGTHLTGILSILTSGGSLISISIEARAQLAAICGGVVDIEIGETIQLVLIGWMTGCDTGFGSPSPSPSSSMALPSSTVPAIPASSTPCDTLTSETVVPIATSTEVPAASSTPCDTLTSETVVPIATSTEAVGPTGSASVPVPSSPAPEASSTPCDTITSETVVPVATSTEVPASSSTPCDTITSETVVPIATSTEAVGPTGSASVPVVPVPSSSAPEASSTPCDTITSETVVPIATTTEAVGPTGTPSMPVISTPSSEAPEASSTPCDTITSETVVPVATTTEAVGPTGTPSVPVIPTPSSEAPEASSTPCETITSETVVPVATSTEVSPEASSTPCETITTETVVPIATSTEAPQVTAAPTMSSKPHKVVTMTTTVSVAACPPSY